MRVLLTTCLLLGLAGAAPPASAAEAPPPLLQNSPQKPALGISADAGAPVGSFDPGVKVSAVLADSTAARMGMIAGDVIQNVNQQAIVSMDDLTKALSTLKVGDAIAIEVLRQGKKVALSGVMMAKPAPPLPIGERLREMQAEIDRLHREAGHPPDLAESLERLVKELNQLQKDLPAATDAFKKLYPNGDFSIKIEISVTSDKSAANPVRLGNGQGADDHAAHGVAPPQGGQPPGAGAPTPAP